MWSIIATTVHVPTVNLEELNCNFDRLARSMDGNQEADSTKDGDENFRSVVNNINIYFIIPRLCYLHPNYTSNGDIPQNIRDLIDKVSIKTFGKKVNVVPMRY
ncbi:hypothetical protein CHUAL_003967 [Chamberlinius hualienensis]